MTRMVQLTAMGLVALGAAGNVRADAPAAGGNRPATQATTSTATATSAPGKVVPAVYPALAGHKPVVYLIGDSTVKNGQDNGAAGGQWGWGHIVHYYFDETKVTVENDAVGGASSRTFFETAAMWPRVLPKLQQGDYVVMQFGHNDDTRPPESDTLRYRSTIKGNGEETVQGPKDANTKETIHTFGWYERQMIAQARQKKAMPVVCSLIPRNSWSNAGKINRGDTSYGLYAQQAADEAGAFFLPLNKLVADKYDALGKTKVTADFFPANEGTHTNWAGARLNAQCVAEGIKGLEGCPLKEFLKGNARVPEMPDVPGGVGGRGPMPGGRGGDR